MDVELFLRGTPVWVWILLAFLIRRGFAALYDREMKIGRLFFLPILFLVWGAYGVIVETELTGISLTMMAIGLLTGTALGFTLWRSLPPLKNSDNPGMIIRAGTPLTLALIVIAFCAKFILTSTLYLHPALSSSAGFTMLFGYVTGLIDGVFWGGTLRLFIPWYRNNN
ncbi:DUF6622 family protein [Kluyvera intermedia]|uniref:DUF1453 domain-containing protein n=1 Tax=Kluyvera intermedia TaxID=61648 RepID=A0ABX6DPJ4_KLUIN|nr:DUF6622 family protein [Kluyvera intermedia]QGH30496.1 hypothetical protein GHC21_12795 [Kluyvera intermedia]QGH39478.1 hypothetical protein GHC38_12795 [Kluyvera intermedia]